MKVIYKYRIFTKHNARTVLNIPINSKLLKIDVQDNATYAWFEIEKDEPLIMQRIFYAIHTGKMFEKRNTKFIQTVVYNRIDFVVHIYEEIEDFISNDEMRL